MAPLEPNPINPTPAAESKSSKKKKSKAEIAQTQPPAASTESETGARRDSADAAGNGTEGSNESPYIKELQKYAWFLGLKPATIRLTSYSVQEHP